MKAVFRVDSSNVIGFGHLLRCLTLAKVLRQRGIECAFICRNHPGNIAARVEESGFKLFMLATRGDQFRFTGKAGAENDKWLGATWKKDAAETCQVLMHIQPDWLIVDHYSIDIDWETTLAPNFKKLVVIDDMADRDHCCDLLLDQNLFVEMQNRYDRRVPSHCVKLLGPKFALLQPEYARLRHRAESRKFKEKKKLLVCFGGSDQLNVTELAIKAALGLLEEFSSIRVVVPSSSPFLDSLSSLLHSVQRAELYCDLPSLAPLMLDSDLCIGAGGATNWERLCLGLPSLVITLAQNQKPVCYDLDQLNLIHLIGDASSVTVEQIRAAFKSVLTHRDLPDWSRRSMGECFGDGADNVADSIIELT